jgi:hypothetical protein
MKTRGNRVVVATVAATFLMLGDTALDAYCPALTPKVCSTLFRSDAVFVATVVSEKHVLSDDDLVDLWRYRVRVKRSFRGTAAGTVEVDTENTSGRRTLNVGRDYLLFADMVKGRLLTASDCGPASDDSRIAENIREIERLLQLTSASVEGEVRTAPSGKGVPGISIGISGTGGTRRTASDINGAFRVALPPGHYRVTVDRTVAVPYDLNWIDGSDLTLQPGECGQLLYISKAGA